MNVCVICGSSEGLNTSMTINVDNEDVTVKICDTDAETATPKMIKEQYLAKQSEIDEIIAKARALGLEINVPTDPGVLATVEKPVAKAPSQPSVDPVQPSLDPAVAAAVEGSKEDGVLPTRVVDSTSQRVQGVAGGEVNAESHMPYSLGSGEDKLDPALLEGRVRMEGAEGRAGQPIAIPAVRVDQTGMTTVRINKRVDDAALQRRFKELAQSADGDGANTHSFAQGGYDVHDCPICKGDGAIKQHTGFETCPKCDGSGLLNS